MARLILTLNNKVLSTCKVPPDEQVSVGRHIDNKLIIDNMAVSSHHATIQFENDKLIIKDLGSRNGTLVNNDKIDTSQLAHQDWVTIGKHIIIVDLNESLSLESVADDLISKPAEEFGDQTMLLDRFEGQERWVGFDYLFFHSAVREDLELSDKMVSIGKNPDADIRITGIWSFFAGKPSAFISKQDSDYFISYVEGHLRPKVNGLTVTEQMKLKHQDIVTVGPVKIEIRRVRRPSN